MGLSIRNALIDDISLIRELTFKVWPQTYSSIISKEQIDYMMEMMYSETSMIKQFKEGCQYVIVYENNDAIGFASYIKKGNSVYHLDKLYILQNQQGKGTGKFVIDHIVEQIKTAGGSALQLRVNRNNISARNFYEKKEFKVIEEADFEIGNGYFMNDYVMEKII